LEVRSGAAVRDWTSSLVFKDGFLESRDNLPAGDYELYLKKERQMISIKLTAGVPVRRYLCSDTRQLEAINKKYLQITHIAQASCIEW
jgi:hypothetical protein